jgi:hypothetical protein
LKHICKSYKRNKKTEKEKEETKKNKKKGPGGNDLAQLQIEPTAHFPANPKRYPLSLTLADWWDPRVSTDAFFLLRPDFSPE